MDKLLQQAAKAGLSEDVSVIVDSAAGALLGLGGDEGCEHGVTLSGRHVAAIKEGKFLYDPRLVEELARLGAKLANVDRYTTSEGEVRVEPRMTQALLGDLEDLLEVWQRFEDNLLELRANLEFHSQSVLGDDLPADPNQGALRWLFSKVMSVACPVTHARLSSRRHGEDGHTCVPRVKLPAGMKRKLRARQAGALFTGSLELVNEVTDVFVAVRLQQLGRQDLFIVSVFALSVTFLGRLGLALRDSGDVDWRDPTKVKSYLLGLLVVGFEPNFGFGSLIKPALKDREKVAQNLAGASEMQQDVVTRQARRDFRETKTDALNTVLGVVSEDLPQLVLQIIYFAVIRESAELDYAFVAAIIATLLHILQELNKVLDIYRDVPILRTIIAARNLIFNSAADARDVLEGEDGDGDGDGAESEDEDNDLDHGDVKADDRPAAKKPAKTAKPAARPRRSIKSVVEEYLLNPAKAGINARGTFKDFDTRLAPSLVQDNKFYTVVQRARARRGQQTSHQRRVEPSPTNGASQRLMAPMLDRMDPSATLSSVRTVEFSNSSSVDADTLRLLAHRCPNLRSLHLSFCEGIDDRAMQALREVGCPDLQVVTLDNCVHVSDAGLHDLAMCCGPRLRSISLQNLPRITNAGLSYLAKRCNNLESISLDRDPHADPGAAARGQLGDATLLALGEHCGSTLRRVRLGHALGDGVTKKGLQAFLLNCSPYLEELTFSGLEKVDDGVVSVLGDRGRYLTTLRLDKTSVSDEGVSTLSERCKNLRLVSLADTNATPAAVRELVKRSNWLEYMQYEASKEQLRSYVALFERQRDRIEEHDVDDVDGLVERIGVSMSRLGQHLESRDGVTARNEDLSLLEDQAARLINYVRRLHYRGSEVTEDPGEMPGYTAEQRQEWDLMYREADREAMESLLAVFDKLVASLGNARKSRNIVSASLEVLASITRRVSGHQTLGLGGSSDAEGLMEEEEAPGAAEAPEADPGQGKRLSGASGASSSGGTRRSARRTSKRPSFAGFPYPSLAPFGVVSTRDINLRLDLQQLWYQLVVPRSTRSRYCSADVDADSPHALEGNLSPLSKLSGFSRWSGLGSAPAELRDVHQRLYVPAQAVYFCYAYPIMGARSDFGFHARRGPDDVALRLVTFGGYLYFDAQRRFLSASALSVGNTFSFNGPFTLSTYAQDRLDKQARWQGLMRLASQNVEYAWVFPQETILAGTNRHNLHGGFAYRERGSNKASLFTLAPLIDVVAPPATSPPTSIVASAA